MLRFVVFFLALIVLIPMIRGVLGGLARLVMRWAVGTPSQAAAQRGPASPPAQAGSTTLHKDPVCGTYVSEAIAVSLRAGAQTVWFCSAACRDKYSKGA